MSVRPSMSHPLLLTAALAVFLPGCGESPDPECEGVEDRTNVCAGDTVVFCEDGFITEDGPCLDCSGNDDDGFECADDNPAFLELTVAGYQPADASIDVALDIVPAIQMDLPFTAADVSGGGVQLQLDGVPVAGNVVYGEGPDELVSVIWGFQPTNELEPGRRYIAILKAGAVVPEELANEAGAASAGTTQDYEWSFTTVADDGFRFTSSVPSNGATNVSQDIILSATFNNDVAPDSVVNTSVTLVDSGGNDIGGNLSVDGSTVTFDPYSWLDAKTNYTLTLNTDVVDVDGMGAETNTVVTFRTVGSLDWDTVSPADGNTNVSIDTPLVMTFNVDIDPASVTNDSIQPRASRTMMDVSNYTVPGVVTVDGNQLTFTPTNEWQEYETAFEIRLDNDLRGINGERLSFPDRPEFTTPFFSPTNNYTVHTIGSGRTQSMDLTLDQYRRAHFSSEIGTQPSSRWAFTAYGAYWRIWNIQDGSLPILAGKLNGNPAITEGQAGNPYQNQLWTMDNYGGHPNFTQGRGESPSLYYVKTQQWGDTLTLTTAWDSGLGMTKAYMSAPTGSIHQLFW